MNFTELSNQHEEDTRLIANLLLKRRNLASLVNRLANLILENGGHSDNDRHEAEDAIEKVKDLL